MILNGSWGHFYPMERLRDLKKISIFWSNYKLNLRSYGQLLSLFLLIPAFNMVSFCIFLPGLHLMQNPFASLIGSPVTGSTLMTRTGSSNSLIIIVINIIINQYKRIGYILLNYLRYLCVLEIIMTFLFHFNYIIL